MQWRLGVVGSPIAHSLSPTLHEAGLALAGLQGSSRRLEIVEAEASSLRDLMGASFDALSVTMPLKAAAAGLCDHLDERAASLGVVNSLLWRDGQLWGAASDGPGFIDALRGVFDVGVENFHVVVLGAGGAARAIVDSLVLEGATSVSVHGRSGANVAKIVARHRNVVDHNILYRPVDLIINTTPVSSRALDAAVIQGVTRDTIAIDITYDPVLSPWLALHADLGCRHSNGLAMLAFTVTRQMNWWWNTTLDGAQLLKAVA